MAEISREQESGTTWSRKPVPIFIFHQQRHLVLLGVLLPAPLYIHVTVSNHNLSNCDFLSVVCCLLDGRDFFCILRPSIQLYVHKRSHLCLWRAPSSTVYLLVFCFGRLFSNANLHADDDCGGSVRAKTVLARITCFREMAIWRATGFCRRGRSI